MKLTRKQKRIRKTRKIGGMIEFKDGKWKSSIRNSGIVSDYSKSEASFLNQLGLDDTNDWFLDTTATVQAFRNIDENGYSLEHPHVFRTTKMKLDKIVSSLSNAYEKRMEEDERIRGLSLEEKRYAGITDEMQQNHTNRTKAIKKILYELYNDMRRYREMEESLRPVTRERHIPERTFTLLEGSESPS